MFFLLHVHLDNSTSSPDSAYGIEPIWSSPSNVQHPDKKSFNLVFHESSFLGG